MHESYLVAICGYEGIDGILGAFPTGEKAAEKLKEWRELAAKLAETGKYPEGDGYTIEKRLYCVKPDALCLQKVSEESPAECCCSEFGVGIKGMWLY